MELASIRRRAEWQKNELRRAQQEYHTAELAVVTSKQKLEEAKKKVDAKKYELERYEQEVRDAEDEFHRTER